MRVYDKKSYELWEKRWKKALKKGVCPIAACDLSKATCAHLDKFLAYDPTARLHQPQTFSTDTIEEFSSPEEEASPGVWALFKTLRKYPLKRDQIGILVRKFGIGMSNRQILDSMGWTSHSMLYTRYRQAVATLKEYGFKSGGFL